ncbi:4-amino-4-deoxychorismate lyase [Anaerovirgula multivorans]|uniref:4-amino-4-deoxychorismate lyase n=1 Tax=Anaerovirgula multivorans TaxID=312168 RepID=A0A239JD77_9FIRM|nr:aminotransferase class IV [Anaerovirgula multivorans]SNT03223.1 4-amino-4-deoxychorismate lyase [Anaerovirgula multivorans]
MYVSINGKLISLEKATISLESEGFLYGYGVFETIKFENRKVYFLKEHLERMKDGLEKLNLFLDADEAFILDQFYNLREVNKIPSGVLKITCTKNKDKQDLILSTRENRYSKEDYVKGFKLCSTDVKRNPHSIGAYIKSHNYMENYLVRQQAVSRGYDEVIFTNVYDEICEGTIANIFFIKTDKVYTPAIECGILPGIIRKKVIDLVNKFMLPVEIGKYSKEDLLMAEEVFLTNSLMEIMPVSQIDDYAFDIKKNPFTQRVMKHFSMGIGR